MNRFPGRRQNRGGVFQAEKPASHGTGRNYSGKIPVTIGRIIGLFLVRLYQLTLSGFVGGNCRHFPTCSEYAYEAIARHGLWAGSWMALFRLVRCGPGGTHGLDPVPETLGDRYVWYEPWRFR